MSQRVSRVVIAGEPGRVTVDGETTRHLVNVGPPGPAGPPGAGARIEGVVDAVGDLPVAADPGSIWIVRPDMMHVWDEVDGWQAVGQVNVITGPKINDLPTRPGGPQPTDEIWLASAGAAADFKSTIAALKDAIFNPDAIQVGTFSPTLRGSASDPTVVYQHQTGRYWKLGRLAFVEVRVDWATVTGGSGVVRVELPTALTCAYNAFSNVMPAQTLRVVYPSGVTSIVARPREGEQRVEFIGQGSNLAGASTIGLTHLNDAGRLSFAGVMITDN